jgi:hypothetical protein
MMRIGEFEVSPEAVELVPESVARENDVLPLRYTSATRRLEIAMPDTGDQTGDVIQKLQFILNLDIDVRFADVAVLHEAVDAAYSLPWTRVTRCRTRIAKPCDRRWLELIETPSPDRRLCLACDKLVHLCRTDEDAVRHAILGNCVALLARTEIKTIDSGLIEFMGDIAIDPSDE